MTTQERANRKLLEMLGEPFPEIEAGAVSEDGLWLFDGSIWRNATVPADHPLARMGTFSNVPEPAGYVNYSNRLSIDTTGEEVPEVKGLLNAPRRPL